jgi:hypothetical protein
MRLGAAKDHIYEVRPRNDKRGVNPNLRCAPIGLAVVCRAGCSEQCNRLRKGSQPLTQCCDSRLR